MLADPNPRVRLEAIRTASFLNHPEAIKILAVGAGQPTDLYLDYMIRETGRAISGNWKSTIVQSNLLEGLNEQSTNYLLGQLSNSEVLALPMTDFVASHLVYRSGIEDSIRIGAIQKTAKRTGKSEVSVLLDFSGKGRVSDEGQNDC